jgi:hypothetical protein
MTEALDPRRVCGSCGMMLAPDGCCPCIPTPNYDADMAAADAEHAARSKRAVEADDPKPCMRCSEMHRRAQRLEGIEAHMVTLREKHEQAIKAVRRHGARRVIMVQGWLRAAMEQLVAAGVPDHVDDRPKNWKMRRIDVLIDRVIAQRDDARAEAKRWREQADSNLELLRDAVGRTGVR